MSIGSGAIHSPPNYIATPEEKTVSVFQLSEIQIMNIELLFELALAKELNLQLTFRVVEFLGEVGEFDAAHKALVPKLQSKDDHGQDVLI